MGRLCVYFRTPIQTWLTRLQLQWRFRRSASSAVAARGFMTEVTGLLASAQEKPRFGATCPPDARLQTAPRRFLPGLHSPVSLKVIQGCASFIG